MHFYYFYFISVNFLCFFKAWMSEISPTIALTVIGSLDNFLRLFDFEIIMKLKNSNRLLIEINNDE